MRSGSAVVPNVFRAFSALARGFGRKADGSADFCPSLRPSATASYFGLEKY